MKEMGYSFFFFFFFEQEMGNGILFAKLFMGFKSYHKYPLCHCHLSSKKEKRKQTILMLRFDLVTYAAKWGKKNPEMETST